MLDTRLPPSGLLDRAGERDALERLVAGVRASQGRGLVLRGEAGVGKTALLGHLSAAAEGCRITRAAGVESEMELAFAGLHALCAHMLDRLPAAAKPATRRAVHGVRPERRTATGSLPRRIGGPEPAGRRCRGPAARVHRRRRAVAGPGVRAVARVRGAPAVGGAGRIGVRAARVRRRARARGFAGARPSRGWPTTTPVSCWTQRFPGRSTNVSGSAFSPRPAAIRSRCWSCPAG